MTSAQVNYGVLRTGRVYCSTPCLKSPGVSTDAPDTRSFYLVTLIGVGWLCSELSCNSHRNITWIILIVLEIYNSLVSLLQIKLV
jgi:hypothetical protein